MKQLKTTSVLLLIGLLFSCQKEETTIVFDHSFAGAKLDSLVRIDANTYEAFIFPAFEPVNKSPYFAFSITS